MQQLSGDSGNLLSTWQLSDAFGIFLGFSSNLATLHIDDPKNIIIWRIQIAATLIPTIILLFLVYFMPGKSFGHHIHGPA
jgi:hypothetical protein